MYKAFSSELLWFPGRFLRDDIPLAVKFGYEGINFDIKRESASCSPDEFSDLFARSGLRPGTFALPVEFREDADTFEAGLKSLRSYCDFARKAGALRCTAYLLPFSDTLDYGSNFAQHRERLSLIAGILGEHGIRLGLEFLAPPSLRRGKAHEFIHNLDGILELLDAIGSPNLGHLLDVFHWDLAGQAFDDFGKISGNEQVVAAHFNDAPLGVSREDQPSHQRELPGATGVLRIGEFIRGLQNLGYDGPVLAEPFSESLRAMPFEDAARAAKEAMDRVWPE